MQILLHEMFTNWRAKHFQYMYVIFKFGQPTHMFRGSCKFFLLEDCLSDCNVVMV